MDRWSKQSFRCEVVVMFRVLDVAGKVCADGPSVGKDDHVPSCL